MPQIFVPFSAPRNGESEERRQNGRRVSIMHAPAETRPYAPPAAPTVPVVPQPTTPSPASDPAAESDDTVAEKECCNAEEKEPQVVLEKEGDKITKIKITCSCGKLHEFTCEY